MTTVFLDGTESKPSNILTLNPADYPALFGIRLVTLIWEYDIGQESTINGFKIYNNGKLICETANPSSRQISCEVQIIDVANRFTIKAIDLSGAESSPSNSLQYSP